MQDKLEKEIQENGPFIAILINRKGTKFYKGFESPFLRDKAVKKMKYTGVKSIGKMDYTY